MTHTGQQLTSLRCLLLVTFAGQGLSTPGALPPGLAPEPVLPGNSARLIMPGMIIKPMGSILR
jgi:hypothetical protein